MRSLFFSLILLLLSVSAHAAETVTIATNVYPPSVTENRDKPGVVVEIVSKAFALSGIEVEYKFLPWKRCTLSVERGTVFAALPYIQTPQRHSFAVFSDTILASRSRVIYNCKLHPGFDFTTNDELNKYVLGAILGWATIETWKRLGLKFRIAPDYSTAFRMLKHGRFDVMCLNENVARIELSKHPEFQDVICISRTPYEELALSVMASKAYPGSERLIKILNENLKILRKSGVLDEHYAAQQNQRAGSGGQAQ